MVKVECFFDCASPWAYIGFSNLPSLGARLGLDIAWRPVVVGFVFAQVNQDIYVSRRMRSPMLKGAYEQKELQAWADHAGVVVRTPPKCGHPVNSIKPMRACCALRASGKLVPFAIACYEALWRDGRNLGDDAVLADICRQIGLDPDTVLAAIASEAPKHELKRNSDELVRRGGFGVPTFYVDDELMFFGNNRLRLVEHHLRSRLCLPTAVAGEHVDA
jgi:2-hydroxychromene-2-carboxylate isomerase